MNARSPAPLLEVEALVKHHAPGGARLFGGGRRVIRAVDGISFSIARGETLALVGESGCGKTTTARLVLRLHDVTAGAIRYDGQDITHLAGEMLKDFRKSVQVVFQDPFGSLNPRMKIGEILEEPLVIHGRGERASRRARVLDLLNLVGLTAEHADRFPHELSGGQRQRAGIARALALEPSLIVCDEPVSALDVSIQAQVVNLLKDLQRQLGLSYLFIAHDLAVVKHVASRVAVMYLGKIVETASAEALFANPRHPYTRALLTAIPRTDPRRRSDRPVGTEDASSTTIPQTGCRFNPRCPLAIERCCREEPSLEEVGPGHRSACHRSAELPAAAVDFTLAPSRKAAERLRLYAQHRAGTR